MKLNHVQFAQNHMATTFEFRISCEEGQTALAERGLLEAHHKISNLENELSEFLPESPVYRLNHSDPMEPIPMSQSAMELLELSEKLRILTSGSFDCLAKSQSSEKPGISWDQCTRTAWRRNRETHLGFGAIGKGYALDQARAVIEALGFHDYYLSGGGSSLIMSGFAGPGDPWKWGWSWKKDDEGEDLGITFSHPSGAPISVGVSGLHEKGNHILHPSGKPLETDSLSALVSHPSAAMADALSTSLFVSGWDKGLEYLEKLPLQPAVAVIGKNETPRWNGLFHKLWGACASLVILLSVVPSAIADDENIDLSSMGGDSFTPYITERNRLWMILPALALCLVLIHLKKDRRKTMRKKTPLTAILAIASLWGTIEKAGAVVVEPMGSALGKLLGATKGIKKKANGTQDLYYIPGSGAPKSVAVVEKGIYPPDCTHTWVIGINPKTAKVTEVRVHEMSCPHAFPTKEASFRDQYVGKGPADVKKLKDKIDIKAKATGSCNLMTEAVQRSITGYMKMKAQLK